VNGARETSLDLLSAFLFVMKFRFGAILYSNSGKENSDPGQTKCSYGPHLARGPQVPHPCAKQNRISEWNAVFQ